MKKQIKRIETDGKLLFLDSFQVFNKPNNNCIEILTKKYRYEEKVKLNSISVLKVRRGANSVLAALDNIIITGSLSKDPYHYFIYPDYRFRSIKFSITLNEKNFPNLIPESKINNILLLKYMREIKKGVRIKAWRICVITDHCQIYHNFPSQSNTAYEGEQNRSDINTFQESVIWDLPNRKFPVKNIKCKEYEQYYPGLPDECYVHHPPVSSEGFTDWSTVNINDEEHIVSRFYFPSRKEKANPFTFMGGYTNDYQMTTIGTYGNNISEAVRTCVFFSSDGGRQWFNRYEFGDMGEYEFLRETRGYSITNWGNMLSVPVTNKKINKHLAVRKRNIDYSDEHIKDQKIIWGPSIEIVSIACDEGLKITTLNEHGLLDGDVIALFGECKEIDWMLSNKAEKVNLLFKVEVADKFSFFIHEYIASSDNTVCCRHIHHINRQKDGWLIGTGEIFPNSWLLFIQQKECDYFNKKSCNAQADMSFFILNSSKNSVQRTIGCEFISEDKMIFASDHSTLSRPIYKYGEAEIERSSAGIYIGNTGDINDFHKYQCVYDSQEVGYFFRKINNLLLYGGQLGEIAISCDNGKTWQTGNLDSTLRCYRGKMDNACMIDNYIIKY